MLPSWSDRIRIALTPEKAAGVRIKRGFTSRVVEKHIVACPQSATQQPWEASVAALTELLSQIGQESGDAALIVSNRFVRYAMVPWSENLNSPKEEMAFARHCFGDVYGNAVDGWDLRLSRGRIGESRIASAVDSELIKSLREVFAKSRLRIRSIQPYLMAAVNRWRRSIDGGDGLFVVAENRLYACAALLGGKWVAVHTGAIDGSLADELPLILERESLWCGMKEQPTVFLHVPEQPEFELPPGQSWTVKRLVMQAQRGFSPVSDAQYTMAMSAEY